jgi:site-specific recombinase XerD
VSALVDAYLTHLAVERRLSPNTVESYGRDLAQLSAAAAALDRPVELLDRRALEQVVRQMMGEGRSPKSVARAVACFRGFFRFLVISGRREDNPAADVQAPRAWKALPKFLSPEEVDRLLGASRGACATARSSSCSMRRGCACRKWSAFGSRT